MGAEQSLHIGDSPDYKKDFITFLVNGREYTVNANGCDSEITPRYFLVDYLRDKLGLTGTKYMCREGGCGSCMVTIRSTHPLSGRAVTRSVNSCLLPLFACDGLDISTVERLGDSRKGYHPIQENLVKFGGTQCGFCTPGFVMNMHSLVQNNPRFSEEDVEYSMDSNLCRCTGYRPIIDAFKSLATSDIEDLHKCSKLKRKQIKTSNSFEIIQSPRNIHLNFKSIAGQQWFKMISLKILFDIFRDISASQMTYKLVAGNTSEGAYDDGPYDAFIQITDIPELHLASMEDKEMILGGGVTITAAIGHFKEAFDAKDYIWAKEFHKHFRRIACLSIRNTGTLAGNLMIKHAHREFVSDVFTLLECIGATLKIASSPTLWKEYSLLEFLELDMRGKVILSIHLPTYSPNYVFRTFKISRRQQHSLAYVNAAFLFNIGSDASNFQIKARPSLVYGGIRSDFVHAIQTENHLAGKNVTVASLQAALTILKTEAKPVDSPPSGSPEYRLALCQSYLYKFFLGILGSKIDPSLRSGAEDIEIPLHTGSQTFDTDRSKWPLYQPIPKLESIAQVSGRAEFINDIRPEFNELFGVFVVTTMGNCRIKSIDATQALMTPEVVAFITAIDVPGQNNYTPFYGNPEPIFAQDRVTYAGQPVGLLVARNKYAAFGALGMVRITYQDIQKPVLEIRDAKKVMSGTEVDLAMPCRGLDHKTAKKVVEALEVKAKEKGRMKSDNKELIKVKGEFNMKGQYHFHMETQICICVPKENGMTVYSATQFMDMTQAAVASALAMPVNSVNVQVRRLGGGFGGKISKAGLIACAGAVAAHVTGQPVRVALDFSTNMQMIGKRLPYRLTYEVEVDPATGKIHSLDGDIVCDGGAFNNEPTSLYGMICTQNCYRADNWNLRPGAVETNTAPNTYCRAPGSSQGVASIETVMEHIAHTLNKDPVEVRKVNFIQKGDPLIGVPGAMLPTENFIPKLLKEIVETSDFNVRRNFVQEFNKRNRFKKRGISMVPQRFPSHYHDLLFPAMISVYHVDGTVNVSHGGIEMGQGLNTKVAQVVANTLGISLDMVRVQPSNSVTSPNTGVTAGSVTSELACFNARQACLQLLEKLQPVREQMAKDATWQQLIAAAHMREILLTAQFQGQQGDLVSYDIWIVAIIEVEVDVLTGDYRIVRADILEDAGQSLSPLVDIGQVEGAFVMGLGWWLTEELVYDRDSGALLTDNTWTYKIMMPHDIPGDFRVALLQNAPNPYGVLSSKATGEPPLNMSCSVIFALRNAIDSARRDAGNYDWYQMDGPVTREVIRRLSLTSPEHFTF